MADFYSKEKRSLIMSSVLSRDTAPELLLRRTLFAYGFRFRKNVSSILGKPDVVLRKFRTVIFVNGCFWHGHNCKAGKLPKSNIKFWTAKILANKDRDKRTSKLLRSQGWKVIIIWQCKLKGSVAFDKTIRNLLSKLILNVPNR
jgi:DNA mismatch endonuclease, patch repair protein